MGLAARIAEGCGRDSNVDFAVELRRAKASASELEYFLLLSRDLGHLADEWHQRLTNEVVEIRKMISGLIRKL
jgi:four helix bundle protein